MRLEANLRENVPLSDLTSLAVGGPARYLMDIDNAAHLANALTWARTSALAVAVLGDGTNVVAADQGFDGLIIRMHNQSIVCATDGTRIRIAADAGVTWDALVDHCVQEGYSGIECLSGIPGRVGAAPVQNIGAYGQQLSTTLDAVHAVERGTGNRRRIPSADCALDYRTSIFKRSWRDGWVITKVELELERRPSSAITHPDLVTALGAQQASVADVRRAVLEVRRSKSMLLDAEDPNSRSAGSFFVNPVVPTVQAERVANLFAASEMPQHPITDCHTKLSAAWLIERCGFARGESKGRVGLSHHHALAIVNRGNATAADIITFANSIRSRVAKTTGVVLEPEPVFIGFDGPVFKPLPPSG